MTAWHLITCEYPPQVGGLSDYTFVIAAELAKTGDVVHVWCRSAAGDSPLSPGVTVHRELGRFSLRDLYRAGKLLNRFPGPRRLFVQWVPHGYGYRSVNIFFCLWLWIRARLKHDQVQIMFHEVWLSFGGSWKANLAAAAHRFMIVLLKHAASSIWIAGESWKKYLAGGKVSIGWLPVPSNIRCEVDATRMAAIRGRYSLGDGSLIGHFGIGDALVEKQLWEFIPGLLRELPLASFLLIGKVGEKLAQEMRKTFPELGKRIFATGILPPNEIAHHIGACGLIVQPYIDGISTRRGAAMAALANGRPLLTTSGHSTEPFWRRCDQVAMVPANSSHALIAKAKQLLEDPGECARMAVAGRRLYETLFDVSLSVEVLRGTKAPLKEESIELAIQAMQP